MLEQNTGKVVRIGECFEVAMLREKVSDKVPLHLMHMPTHAKEVNWYLFAGERFLTIIGLAVARVVSRKTAKLQEFSETIKNYYLL